MSKFEKITYAKPKYSLKAPVNLATRNVINESGTPYRSLFMQDRDRVLYSTPFRLLAGKTQVYVSGIDDNMRTRLTHTLEVAQIAKTIATNLRLDVDLTEAIALAHDIGHTPYGHAGERELHQIMNPSTKHAIENSPLKIDSNEEEAYIIKTYTNELGFKHNLHGIEVAIHESKITNNDSLSLTNFTLYGIAHHSAEYYKNDGDSGHMKVGYYKRFKNSCLTKHKQPAWSFEAFVVAQADEIAQRHHDLEDAIRGHLLSCEYVYDQIYSSFRQFFTSRDNKIFNDLKKSKDNKNETVFYAELSRLIVNMLVNRIIFYSTENLNYLITKYKLNATNFNQFVVEHSGTEEERLIAYDHINSDMIFEASLKSFKQKISSNVLDAYEIQCADAKGGYIIRKVAQALYNNPRQLPDEYLIEYGERIGMFDYNTARDNMRIRGKGIVRNEILSRINEDSVNESRDYTLQINKINLLRCICNYIASQTDRTLEKLYQQFYG